MNRTKYREKVTSSTIPEVLAYCSVEPIMNLFMIGDIMRYGCDSSVQDIWIQRNGGDIEAVYLRYHDTLLLYSHHGNIDPLTVKHLLQQHPIRSINGKRQLLQPLSQQLLQWPVKKMYFSVVKHPSKQDKLGLSTKHIHTATTEDAMRIAEAFGYIAEFKHLYAEDLESRHKQIASRIIHNEGTHIYIEKAGKVISHGNTAAETNSAAMIGGLMTLPEYRRRGYASTIVSALVDHITSHHKQACTLTSTPAEESFVKHFGFTTVGEWWILSKSD